MHRERHQALIKTGLAEKSLRVLVYQFKNARATLLDVALERSHWRRLVCAPALGKMQQKAIVRYKNLLGNTLILSPLFEIEMKLLYAIRGANRGEICLADSEAQGSAVRQSLCTDCQSAELA
jgi:hypothetical protein